MALSILEMVLPVLLMLALGYVCSGRRIVSAQGLAGMKALVSQALLPVVLFNAFFTAEYSGRIMVTFLVVYAACALGLGAGFLLRRLVGPQGKFFPFLVTNFEGGMLGYALFGLLYPGQTRLFAMADIGQTLAAYTVFLAAVQAVNSGRADPKTLARQALRNPALIGTFLGVALGATGVGKWVLQSAVGPLVSGAIAFVTAPVSGLILVIVGYELSFQRKMLRPVLTTAALRLAVMGALLAVGALVIFAILPFDKPLLAALMLGFSLPAPFIVPLYAQVGEDAAYISTTLSVETLISVALFVAIAAYTLAGA